MKELNSKLNRYQLKKPDQINERVNKILKGPNHFFRVAIIEIEKNTRVQKGCGRPGHKTQYVDKKVTSYSLKWEFDKKDISDASSRDGIFPLVTNTDLEAKDALKTYKNQPFLATRFNTLKSVNKVAPVYSYSHLS